MSKFTDEEMDKVKTQFAGNSNVAAEMVLEARAERDKLKLEVEVLTSYLRFMRQYPEGVKET